MKRLGLALMVALCVLLFGVKIARAAWSPVTAIHYAERLWGQQACLGKVQVFIKAPPAGGDTAGEARWTVDGEGFIKCQIYVSPIIYHYPWPWFCTDIMHEYGHLLGFGHGQGHTREQREVMSPWLKPDRRRCGRTPRA